MINATRLAFASMVIFGITLPSETFAIDNAKQLLTGGSTMAQGSDVGGTARLYAAPGLQNAFGLDVPGSGEGPSAGAIRMPQGGTLSKLRVHVLTQNTPASGSFTLTVLKNGNPTSMKCTVSGQADCNSNNTVSFAAGDRLVVEAKNTFTGSGLISYTYAMLLD